MKRPMSSIIAELRQELIIQRDNHRRTVEKLDEVNRHLTNIAGENESLRKDKAWLQNMHSYALQAFFAKPR